MIPNGRPKCVEETCANAILCATNITQFGPESKPGIPGERPAADCLRNNTVSEGQTYV